MINLKESEGKDGKWYRYWSDKAKDSMEAHVARLMEAYGDNYVTVLCEGRERKPICSMWDPIVAPSFDEEGKSRYLRWLSDEYQGDIRLFNQAYGVEKESFASLEKEDYWFECRYEKDVLTDETDRSRLTFSEEDVKNQTPRARMLMDNRKWQCKELCLYFEDMEKRLHKIDPALYLCPDMAQWGYFLNVDCTHFISVPVTPDGDAEVYVTACHHSMMRSMNRGREFVGGIYW